MSLRYNHAKELRHAQIKREFKIDTPTQAFHIIRGGSTCLDHNRKAWQYLIDTAELWNAPEAEQMIALQLIERGICTPPNWKG
jgi:hypothetical protein